MANDLNILTENEGHLTLSNFWVREHHEEKRQAPGIFKETKLPFQGEIKKLQAWYEITDDLILNFDHTLSFDLD